jgi:carbon storage regulator
MTNGSKYIHLIEELYGDTPLSYNRHSDVNIDFPLGAIMLVLTLKENEALVIGDNIRVLVVKVMAGKQVRLGIEAPPGILVLREEGKPVKG